MALALGVPQLVIGVWALAAPGNWFRNFPGFDPRLVASQPPYNEHLASDVGAGFLATGIVLLAAACWGNRAALLTALLAYSAFTVPHTLYHATNPSEPLTGLENASNVLTLSIGIVLAGAFAWHLRPRTGMQKDARTSAEVTGVAPS